MKTISLKKKKNMFLGLFNFRQNRCTRILQAWPFFGWFWVFFYMLKIPFQFLWNNQNFVPILLKHSKFCSYIQIQLEEKNACFWDFSIFGKIVVSWTLPVRPFFGWLWVFFEMLKIPFQFFWNIQNFVLSWKQSVWRKKRHFWGTFQFGPKSLYPDLTGVAIFWVILSIFRNVENTLPIFLKHSKFCSFTKTISLKKKKHVFGTFQFSAKSLYPDLTGVAFFWLILSIFLYVENTLPILVKHSKFCSNSSETFKILFFYENNQFEEKKACFGDTSILTKIAVSGPYRRGLFLVDFEYFLKFWKYPSNSFWNIQNFVLSWTQSVWRKKRHVFGTFQFSAKIAVSGHSGVAIFWLILSIFRIVENTLPILVKHSKFCSNSSETFKILFFHENNQFEEKKGMFWGHFNLDQNRCIRT